MFGEACLPSSPPPVPVNKLPSSEKGLHVAVRDSGERRENRGKHAPLALKNISFRQQLALLCTVLLLQACVSVPFDYPGEASTASPPSAQTALGEGALQWRELNAGNSGFLGLPNGMEALGVRLRLIELAEHSIDAQYFLIKPDQAGSLFASGLLLAADSGVKVRLLLDDIFTTAADSDIAEEYFELNQKVQFDDYEVLAIGPVVEEVSAGFDAFWNSDLSVPMEAFDIAVPGGAGDGNWPTFCCGEVRGFDYYPLLRSG